MIIEIFITKYRSKHKSRENIHKIVSKFQDVTEQSKVKALIHAKMQCTGDQFNLSFKQYQWHKPAPAEYVDWFPIPYHHWLSQLELGSISC